MNASAPPARVRVLFLLVVTLLPVQLAIRELIAEPYPALYQPSFGGAPRSAEVAASTEPVVVVTTRSGEEHEVPYRDVLPPTGVLPAVVFRVAFFVPGDAVAVETRAWLRDRLLAMKAGSDPMELIITWENVEYDLRTGERRVVAVERITAIDVSEDS